MMRRRWLTWAAALAMVAGWSTPTVMRAQRTAPEATSTLAIVGGFLIDGSGGPPIPDSVILVNTDEEIRVAIEGGADLLDHAGSGHQNPLYSDETIRLMAREQIPVAQSIAHRVALYPAHLAWPERLHNPALRRELGRFADPITQSLASGLAPLSYFSQIQMQMRVAPAATRQLADAGCRIIMGTDSGTPGYFHSEAVWREAEALVRMAGLSPMEVVVGSTRLAAQALGVNTGAIHPGRLADIILVRGNPLDNMIYLQNVERVIKGGIVFDPAAFRGTE